MTQRRYEAYGLSEYELNYTRAGKLETGDRVKHPQYGELTLSHDAIHTVSGNSVELRTEELNFPIYSAKGKRWEKVND